MSDTTEISQGKANHASAKLSKLLPDWPIQCVSVGLDSLERLRRLLTCLLYLLCPANPTVLPGEVPCASQFLAVTLASASCTCHAALRWRSLPGG